MSTCPLCKGTFKLWITKRFKLHGVWLRYRVRWTMCPCAKEVPKRLIQDLEAI